MSYTAIRWVKAWPSVVLRASPSGRGKGLTQCLWGDWVGLYEEFHGGWLRVRTRGRDGWLKGADLTEERPLEVNFVDIGQGDGTFIVTPGDEMMLIDAGEGDNMHRFLRWRFNLTARKKAPRIGTAIVTHPDQDHYKGFQRLFDDPRFEFGAVLHNGIVERSADEALGSTSTLGGQRYITGLIKSRADLNDLLADEHVRGKKQYAKLMWTALTNGRVADIRAVSAGDVVLETEEFGKGLRLDVLAPVVEQVQGESALRWFAKKPGATSGGDPGKTKNGHSVVALLTYGNVRILLGGDLNRSAEEFLMDHYADEPNAFKADVAKACHHGSSDFTTSFLDRIAPIATVISSGDDEPHSHPRADTLGTLGKHSRGPRPLIFSTELARSAPERIVAPAAIRAGLLKLADSIVGANSDDDRNTARSRLSAKLDAVIQRSVSMYGLITIRTDGHSMIIAQRLERARGTTKWDIYRLEPNADGILAYVYDD
jgi:beta-lactamase superfamily II metal-dependent hydrolase